MLMSTLMMNKQEVINALAHRYWTRSVDIEKGICALVIHFDSLLLIAYSGRAMEVFMENLYDKDYHQWLTLQRELLAQRQFDQLDIENLMGELELGIKDHIRELKNRLATLITHLLKCDYQTSVLIGTVATERVPRVWLITINRSRNNINKLIADNPCLKPQIEDVLNSTYPDGKKDAIKEMNIYVNKNQKLNENSFPDQCPWSYEQIMTEDWYPLNGVNIDD